MLFVINFGRCTSGVLSTPHVSCVSLLKFGAGAHQPLSSCWSASVLQESTSHPLVPSVLSCVHFACEAADCPKLAVENAWLNCSGGDGYHGAQCTVRCRTGYVLQIQRDDELIKSQVCVGAGRRVPLQPTKG